MEDTGLKAILAGGTVIYLFVLLVIAVVLGLLIAAPLRLYAIHNRLVEIRDLLRDGAISQAGAPDRDDGPRLILPSERVGYGSERVAVIAAGIVGLGLLIMIVWMATR